MYTKNVLVCHHHIHKHTELSLEYRNTRKSQELVRVTVSRIVSDRGPSANDVITYFIKFPLTQDEKKEGLIEITGMPHQNFSVYGSQS